LWKDWTTLKGKASSGCERRLNFVWNDEKVSVFNTKKTFEVFKNIYMSANKVWVFGFYDSHKKTLVFRCIWMPTKFEYLCFLIAMRKHLLSGLYECH